MTIKKKLKTRFLFIAYILTFLYGCNTYVQKHFLTEAFGIDISPLLKDKPVIQKDGFLQVNEIVPESTLYKALFSSDILTTKTYAYVSHQGKQIGDESWGRSVVKIWNKFDGVQQMAIYYPDKRILILGYFDSYGD
ncbi:hypothetical protein [Maribacter sp. 2210JD10-5]|uniref:hypothetical protein n=1 Tax=Maribacter sp. 2210JD10-5 TaxID=3386272 RepID=UPI0039BC8AB8